MNYEALSDDEIDHLVAVAIYGENNTRRITNGVIVGDRYGLFSPCKSWADAGPTIQEHLIALKPVPLYVGGYRWFATEGDGLFGLKAADNNPLRAAMMLFLAMQEKANA